MNGIVWIVIAASVKGVYCNMICSLLLTKSAAISLTKGSYLDRQGSAGLIRT